MRRFCWYTTGVVSGMAAAVLGLLLVERVAFDCCPHTEAGR